MDSLMGRLGDEASMLAHIEACTGIRHTTYAEPRRRRRKRVAWKEIRWPTWSSETPHRHGKTPKARMAL
jgi:hypothetical protein